MLRQQLDALSRLAAAAWRLVAPAPPAESATTVWAGVRNLEKALRLQARVTWALRLIDALRAKLVADLQALDNGQPPNLQGEARSFAPETESPTANEARDSTERGERAERPERLERERFGFESRGSDKDLAEILKRPTSEVIALICRELGLPADWPRLAEEAWARGEADDDGGGGRDWPSSGVYPRVDLRSSPGDKLRMRAQSSAGLIFEAQRHPTTPTLSSS